MFSFQAATSRKSNKRGVCFQPSQPPALRRDQVNTAMYQTPIFVLLGWRGDGMPFSPCLSSFSVERPWD